MSGNRIQARSIPRIGISAVALALVCGIAWSWQYLGSERCRLSRLLSVRVPTSAVEIHIWYRQIPGTYQAELIARMGLPRDEFDLLVQRMGLRKANPIGDGWSLPTRFNTDSSVTWWDPPTEQVNRYYLATNGFQVSCLWNEGTVYILKQGGFGSPWH